MKNGFLLFSFLLALAAPVFSQGTDKIVGCESLFHKADSLRKRGEYMNAVAKLNLVRYCDKHLEGRADSERVKIFHEIQGLRSRAEIMRVRAEKDKNRAKISEAKAERETQKLDSLYDELQCKNDTLLETTSKLALSNLINLARETRTTNPELAAQILLEVWARDTAHPGLTQEMARVFYGNDLFHGRPNSQARLLPSVRIHRGRQVLSAEYSPDNSRFFVRSDSSLLPVFGADGQLLHELKHSGRVQWANFTADSKLLVTATSNGRLSWWRADGTLAGSEPVPTTFIRQTSIRLSPDEQAMWWNGGKVFFKNFAGGQPVEHSIEGEFSRVEYSPGEADLCLVVLKNGVQIRDFNRQKSFGSHLFSEKQGGLQRAFFSFDGKWLLALSAGGHLFFGEIEAENEAPVNVKIAGTTLKFSPETEGLPPRTRTNRLRTVAEFEVRTSVIVLAFSPDNRHFLVAETGRFTVYNRFGWVAFEQELPGSVIQTCQFSKDGESVFVLTGDDQTIRQYRLDRQPADSQPMVHESDVSNFFFNHDGTQIFSRTVDFTLRIWDLAGHPLAVLRHQGGINRAVSSGDGRYILTGSADSTACLWALRRWPGQTMRHPGPVFSTVFLENDGLQIRTVAADCRIRDWKIGSGLSRMVSFERDIDPSRVILNADFSGDGTNFWVLTRPKKAEKGMRLDSTLQFFRASDGQLTGTVKLDSGLGIWPTRIGNDSFLLTPKIRVDKPGLLIPWLTGLTGKMWSSQSFADSKLANENDFQNGLAVGTQLPWLDRRFCLNQSGSHFFLSKRTAVLPPKNAAEPRIFEFESGLTDHVFSADQRLMLVCLANNQAQLWERSNPKKPRRSFPVSRAIIDLSFSPMNDLLAFGCLDGRVQVWDTTGNRVAEFQQGLAVNSVCFSPDGRWLVSGSNDGTARLWMLKSNDLAGCLRQFAMPPLDWAKLPISKTERQLLQQDSAKYLPIKQQPPEPGRWSILQEIYEDAANRSRKALAQNRDDLAVKPTVEQAIDAWKAFFLKTETETNPLALAQIDGSFLPFFRLMHRQNRLRSDEAAMAGFSRFAARWPTVSAPAVRLESLKNRLEDFQLFEKMQAPDVVGQGRLRDTAALGRLLQALPDDEELTVRMRNFYPAFSAAELANYRLQMKHDFPGRLREKTGKRGNRETDAWIDRQLHFISHLTSYCGLDSTDASRYRLSLEYGEMSRQRPFSKFPEGAAGDAEKYLEHIMPQQMKINQATSYALAGNWRKSRRVVKSLLEPQNTRDILSDKLLDGLGKYSANDFNLRKQTRSLNKITNLVLKIKNQKPPSPR